jgi:hypothetical protein
MPGFEIIEELPCRPDLPLSDVLQSLADSFPRISLGRDIEQALISFGILHDRCRFPPYRKNDGALAFLELFQKFTRAAAERRQRLDILGDSEHCALVYN